MFSIKNSFRPPSRLRLRRLQITIHSREIDRKRSRWAEARLQKLQLAVSEPRDLIQSDIKSVVIWSSNNPRLTPRLQFAICVCLWEEVGSDTAVYLGNLDAELRKNVGIKFSYLILCFVLLFMACLWSGRRRIEQVWLTFVRLALLDLLSGSSGFDRFKKIEVAFGAIQFMRIETVQCLHNYFRVHLPTLPIWCIIYVNLQPCQTTTAHFAMKAALIDQLHLSQSCDCFEIRRVVMLQCI